METDEKGNLTFNVNIDVLREKKIMVATPCYGGMNHSGYTRSMIDLHSTCVKFGIDCRTYFLNNESLVQRARNYCADYFLRSDCEHLIFIDSDIEFQAQDVLVLADLQNKNPEYDIIAGPYPKKVISWEKVKAAVEQGVADDNPNILENFTGDYVFNALKAGSFKVSEPLEVLETGTGFMMIRRDTFRKFRDKFPGQSYRPDHVRTADFDGSNEIFAYFDCVIDPVSKRYLSEDYYFCQQVREAGGHIFLAPWVQLKHNGTYTWGGSISALASISQVPGADTSKIKKIKTT